MTKIGYNTATGQAAVFDSSEDMSNWPDYQETQPVAAVIEATRAKRDALLLFTDRWALSDRTMTQDQIDYRQALRDITDHANWPNLLDSDWPVETAP